ncbi:hypothetical protein [Sulfitobacter sp. PS-8MA]|uniref:hypothetical protein n=1 Tax=Sulfitobacter sp. PS-8MA TaxID=3237707 RepID=UPI0034C5CD8F
MADPNQAPSVTRDGGASSSNARSRPTSLGVYDRPRAGGITEIEVIAIALSLLWLIGTLVFFVFLAPDSGEEPGAGLRGVMTLLAVILPLGMIWVAATALRASRMMREESQRLQAAIDAIRHSSGSQLQGNRNAVDQNLSRKLDEVIATVRKTENALAALSTPHEDAPRPAPTAPAAQPAAPEDQPTLALGTEASDRAAPLSAEDFTRALNFPETAEDEAGFTALRRALKDRSAAQLVQAAQDVLTLLSQDGIYMDDLRPDRARPEVWRQFANGARGRTIAPLGGIRDRSSLALANARMRQDPIFRDAAHHFLRRFDRTFAEFEKQATDEEISTLADTRTARAFMLLGRCAGTFD